MVTAQLNVSYSTCRARVGHEIDRIALLYGDCGDVGDGFAMVNFPGAEHAAAAGDDAAVHAIALLFGAGEQAFDANHAGGGGGPAADYGMGGVARVTARGVDDGPTDRWIGKFIAALPGVFDESRQRLEVDGVSGFIESAPAELPGNLFESFFRRRPVAAVDEFQRVANFVDRRFASQRGAEQTFDAANVSGRRVGRGWRVGLFAAGGKITGLFNCERAVHQEESLLRDGRLGPIGRVSIGIGEIERAEERRHVLAFDEAVYAATVRKWRIGDRNGGAAHFVIEPAGDGQERIAKGFQIEPAAVGTPQEPVFGIGRYAFGACFARLAIRGGENDAANEMFGRPTGRP